VSRTPDFSRCIFASGNRGKLREVQQLLAATGIQLLAQPDLNIDGAEESGDTFVENALLKARHAARQSGLPAIADDSGLVVAALGGRPGVRSARYAGENASDADNIAKLLDELRNVPRQRRQASFHCVVALVTADDDFEPLVAQGQWSGLILTTPSGCGGFGYDPVFLDPLTGKAAAQMSANEKNAVSHRGKALRQLAESLQRLGYG
jgi:XTP/dITP diphosphohydrolase